MRQLKGLLVLLAVLLFCSSGHALTQYLRINTVNSTTVHATLSLYNFANTQHVIIFPSTGTFELMVDNQVEEVGYFDILTTITVPANGLVQIPLSYHSPTVFTNDVHVAQARYVLPGNPPAGNPTTFVYGPALSDVNDVNFTLEIDTIGSSGVYGTLIIENPNDNYWRVGFPTLEQARLLVDGDNPAVLTGQMGTTLTIAAHASVELEVSHYQSYAYAAGEHIIQAQLLCSGDPYVGDPISFTVQPTSNDDDQAHPVPALELSSYPNPFNPSTSLSFSLKDAGMLRLQIYNQKGQKVRSLAQGNYPAGKHQLSFDGKDDAGNTLASGIYFARIIQGGIGKDIKLMLMK